MATVDFRLYWWIKRNMGVAKHNLSSSGLSEPDLGEMGLVTDYEAFKSFPGEPEEEFKRAVAELYGVDSHNILPTVGGTEAIYLVNLYMGGKTQSVFVPTPNYEPMLSVPRLLGYRFVDSLNTHARVLVSLTDSNNPTGRSLSEEWVKSIVDQVGSGSCVYIDETFREFGFPDVVKTWFNLDRDKIVVSNTLTKFYGLGGFRVGWIIAGEDKIHELAGLKPFITGEDAAYSLWIGAQAIRNRSRFVLRAKRIVERNRKIVEEFVESTRGIEWSNPDAAPFSLISYNGGVASEQLCLRALKEYGVLIAPAEFFGTGKGFRLCFTHTNQEELVEGLKSLSTFLGEALR
ncbi:MAG: pyridoxal phosphate-dependent aminotransferase [Thermoprotei archaeon]